MAFGKHTAYSVAEDMLGVDVLPDELKERIRRTIELVEKVHEELGTLRSTQVVAHIIVEYELSLKEVKNE
jgi:hypothetical protein